MARLRCSGCGFSMEFKVPPREAITCPQCSEYLEDVTPRAAAQPTILSERQTDELEGDGAVEHRPARPTMITSARTPTRAQAPQTEAAGEEDIRPAPRPTVVSAKRVVTRTAEPEADALPEPEPPAESTRRSARIAPPQAEFDEPDLDEPQLAPLTELEAPPAEPDMSLDEAPAPEPSSEAIVTEEDVKKPAGRKPPLKVQAKRVATKMIGRKQQPTMRPAPVKTVEDSEENEEEEDKPIRLAPAADEEDDDEEGTGSGSGGGRKLKPAVIAVYIAIAGALAFAIPRLLEFAQPYISGEQKSARRPDQPAPPPVQRPPDVERPAPVPEKLPEKAPPDKPKSEEPPPRQPVEVPTLPVVSVVEHKPDEIYKRLLNSSFFILSKGNDGLSLGSGSLVHVEKKLVLTNMHVVQGQNATQVYFPDYKNGDVVTDPTQYKEKGIPAKIVAQDPLRDLALLELEKLPGTAKALPLALKSVSPGAKVYSIGSSGATSKVLWRFTEGSVRQVTRLEERKPRDGIQFKGQVVETQSPINPGDSGGAVVNNQMELVAVVCMIRIDADLVSPCVDIREVRAFLDNYGKPLGLKWEEGTQEPTIDLAAVDKVVLQLLPILEKGTPGEKTKALAVLMQAGPSARLAIPTLLPLIRGNDDEVRRLALLALDRMGAPGPEAVPHLREFLADKHSIVRRYAAQATARMGKDGRSLAPQILTLLADADPETVTAALRAVVALGPDARAAAHPVLLLLGTREGETRLLCAEALVSIGALPREDCGEAAPLLDSPHALVRIAAAGALLTARDDERARALLANVFRDTTDQQAQLLVFKFLMHVPADRLKRLGPGLGELVKSGLKHEAVEMKMATFALVERTAPAPDGSLDDVLVCLNDMNNEVKARAIQTIGRFGAQGKKAVTPLGACLHVEDEKIRTLAMKALAEFGPEARGACPQLILMLAEEKFHATAIATLVGIGKGAVADLTYALRHRDPHVRVGAATALGKIGADARTAVIPLSVLSRSDPFPGVRQAAQTALTLVQAKK